MKKRLKKRTCDAILCSDLHIRADVPLCREDDYLKTQFGKLNFIFDLCHKNNCPLFIGGDIGNKSQWPNWLLEKVIDLIDKHGIEIFATLGQHDLPEHRLDYWQKSGCGVLHSSKFIHLLGDVEGLKSCVVNPNSYWQITSFPFDMPITKPTKIEEFKQVAMTHQMIIENKPLWPGQEALKGHQILKKHPEYDLILSGDNHLPFISEYEGRLLVNPGSMMRTTAAQIDHKPRVYKWFSKENKVSPVFLPIEHGVINRDHIDKKKNKEKELIASINKIENDDIDIELCYEEEIKKHLSKHKVKQTVKNKIWRAINSESD